jgi:ABC-2 type transport system ATP-binding protein
MASLAARFREVELTFESPVHMPPGLPTTWLQQSVSENRLRFVDSTFNEEKTSAEIAHIFGVTPSTTFTPMTLRTIFLAIAKSNRKSS